MNTITTLAITAALLHGAAPLPLHAESAQKDDLRLMIDSMQQEWGVLAGILDSVQDKNSADAAAPHVAALCSLLPGYFKALGMPQPSPEMQAQLLAEKERVTPTPLLTAWGKLQNRSQGNFYGSELLAAELEKLGKRMRGFVRVDYSMLGAVQHFHEKAGAQLHELAALLAGVQDKAGADAAAARVAVLMKALSSPSLMQAPDGRRLTLKRIYKASAGSPLGDDIETLFREAERLMESDPACYGSTALEEAMEGS